MPFAPGTRLGAYEVLSLLGAGGMGEVYRAKDTRLKREVAIKILPDTFANDADRLARFQREAELLASLNHPNIAQIYGLEDRALVLELVEGPTLADRIAQASIPIDEALPIAKQIAEALEAAHEHGIVHRDLKPANIKLTSDGNVKVLDFGLAKAMEQAPLSGLHNSGVSQSPTITSPAMTMGNVILGTAAYMSPEQAKGKPVDKRTDIWAFGCVLFEMLTGTRPFAGEDVADTLAEIIKGDPEWKALPKQTTPTIVKLLHRCLAKDRRKRLSDAAAVRLEIDEVLSGNADDSTPSLVAAQSRRERVAWSLLVVALLLGATLGALLWVRPHGTDVRAYRVSVPPPPGMRTALFRGFGSNRPVSTLAVSPNGQYLAFLATADDAQTTLWVRQLDGLTSRMLPGTDGALSPFWSPDSRAIGFFADGKLKTIELTGGSPLPICDAPANATGSWGRHGDILFGTLSPRVPIHRVLSKGGTPTPVTTLEEKGLVDRHGWPVFLPDGRSFLFLVAAGAGGIADLKVQGVYAASLDSPERKQILSMGSNVAYAQGQLFFLRANVLMAQRFDPDRLELSGESVSVAEDVARGAAGGNYSGFVGTFSVSEAGTLAYQTLSPESRSHLLWLDRNGVTLGELGPIANFNEPELSPDGKTVAVSVLDPAKGSRDIWVYDSSSGTGRRFTIETPDSRSPRWSSDGNYVFFSSAVKGNRDIYRKASSGAGSETVVVVDAIEKHLNDVSQDSRYVIYQSAFGGAGSRLFVRPIVGDTKATPFAASKSSQFWGRFSPNGKWIAYYSDLSGRREVWVARFPEDGSKWQISTTGGMFPRWRRDGRELFYLGPDDKVYGVPVKTDVEAFEFGAPTALFEARPLSQFHPYDVSADGQRFLVSSRLSEDTVAPITLIVNWTALTR